ncbi:hypothetical protein CVIRNUC_001287 [Coccomyxa viridis]|uniref:Transmembrane protein 19 n=1 Tax=Coccomyxa viridis TaxID=1274662 RepID=A0AAV1HT98_9CHLO|nr:hypothetical protein CVIRNUC_001287 [Coccomyxa viridis]
MRRCIPTEGPPSFPLRPLLRHKHHGHTSHCEVAASPSKSYPSKVRASERGAAGESAELGEVRTVLESWRQEEAQATHSSQGGESGSILDTPSLDLSKTEQERQREVERALRLVDAAMKKAEGQLTHIPNLPSARLRRKRPQWVNALVSGARIILLSVLAIWSHACGPVVQLASSAAVGALLGYTGLKKGSLSKSGAIAAVVVGAATLGCSLRAGATLLAFYASSSKLTTLKEELKEVDDEFKKGGQRDWVQVCCNALIPTVIAVLMGYWGGLADLPMDAQRMPGYTAAAGAFLGYFACCCGDTWASEVGQLSAQQPRLITSLRPVRKGTNGGVTLLGAAASVAGGLFMGTISYVVGAVSPSIFTKAILFEAAAAQWQLIPLGLFGGLAGSLIDSALGATLQFTGFNRKSGKITGRVGPDVSHISGWPLLTNNGVNLMSASLCSCMCSILALRIF